MALKPLVSWVKLRYFNIDLEAAKDLVLDQDIDPFFEVLKKKQRDYWIKEEYECSTNLQMPRLKPEVFLDLRNVQETEFNKTRPRLQNVHNYDILTNPFYADKYLYTPAVYP